MNVPLAVTIKDGFTRGKLGLLRPARAAGTWSAWSLLLNLVWEVAQAPLYVFTAGSDMSAIGYSLLHCTLGDGLIALASYLIAATVTRDTLWPARHPWLGGSMAVAFGLAWTVISEWRNVYGSGTWGYSSQMPLLFGIGIAPLLQWWIVPLLTLAIVRRQRPPTLA